MSSFRFSAFHLLNRMHSSINTTHSQSKIIHYDTDTMQIHILYWTVFKCLSAEHMHTSIYCVFQSHSLPVLFVCVFFTYMRDSFMKHIVNNKNNLCQLFYKWILRFFSWRVLTSLSIYDRKMKISSVFFCLLVQTQVRAYKYWGMKIEKRASHRFQSDDK